MAKRKTLFARIDWFLNELFSRIGEPTPIFFKVLAAIWGFLLVMASAVVGVSQIEGATLPANLIAVCKYLIGPAATGLVGSLLPRKDPPPIEPPDEQI